MDFLKLYFLYNPDFSLEIFSDRRSDTLTIKFKALYTHSRLQISDFRDISPFKTLLKAGGFSPDVKNLNYTPRNFLLFV